MGSTVQILLEIFVLITVVKEF